MALGEAFIEVHADLRPFARDLRSTAKPIVENFERQIRGAVGDAVRQGSEDGGRDGGDRVARHLKKSLLQQLSSKNFFVVVAGALGSALDDGISALPTEVKAAIVLGIILATPIISAFLTGAIVAGIGAGFAVLGTVLASQYQSVQDQAQNTFQVLRKELVSSAESFEGAIVDALVLVRTRITGMSDLFRGIFDVSSTFIDPLTQGLLNALEEILQSVRRVIGNIRPFVDELGAGFSMLGDAIGTSIEVLVASGDDGATALRDLISLVGTLILSVSILLTVLTKVYGLTRDVVKVTNDLAGPFSPLLAVLAKFFENTDRAANKYKSFINSNFDLSTSFRGLVVDTKNEAKAIEDYQKALEAASDAVKDQLDLNIDWESSLDDIADSLKKNGDTLDITTRKGQENAREFAQALKIAEERAVERVKTGQLTADQAVLFYDKEIGQLRELARQAGLSQGEFNDLYQQIIETATLRISSSEIGVNELTGELSDANGEAKRLYDLLQLIMGLRRNIGAGAVAGVRGFADGGMHYLPETVRVAEDGPEVTIPLTKPARAAQLVRDSGLDKLLGGSGGGQTLVFIGNEQLDAHMVRIVNASNNRQAMALSHGGRSF